MTVNVPGSDVQGTALQGQVTNLTTLAANNPNNVALVTTIAELESSLRVHDSNNPQDTPDAVRESDGPQ